MDRWLQIILLMPEDDFITNKQLSETLGVSNRTIYNDIIQLNQMMKNKGAQLISKPHYGVKLEVTDKGKYLEFLRSLELDRTTAGDSADARMNKIIEKLILLDAPIKMDDLSDDLYISRSTLKNDLKRVRSFIGDYDLQIDFRSYAGIKIDGAEKDLRRCLAKIERNMIAKDGSFLSGDMDDIAEFLKEIFKRHNYRMATYSFHNFVAHAYVSVCRIRQGREISFVYHEQDEVDAQIRNLAEDVVTTLEQTYHVTFSQSEFQYIFMGGEHSDLRKYFQNSRRDALMHYFSEELFFPNMKETTKEAVLKRLCEAAACEHIPDDIYTHVMKREEIGGTAFGNYVAIPHPDQPMGEKSFVVTGILEQPILWDKDEVQIVFLIFMKAGGDRNLQLFYKSVSRFLSDKALVQRLRQKQTYEELISILDSLSYDMKPGGL